MDKIIPGFRIFFRSDLELADVSIRYQENQPDTNAYTWASDIGSSMFLYLHQRNDLEGGLIIDNNYVISMNLHNDEFYPYIELTFKDPTGFIGNRLHPDDNTTLTFYKKSQSDIVMPVHMDFAVSDFRIVKNKVNTEEKIYHMVALLKIENDITENVAYKGTSFNVLQQISKNMQLGFASNLNDTDDEMTWINPGLYCTKFLSEITNNSYSTDDSFLISYIDLYYNINYIDIEKQLNGDTFVHKSIGHTKIVNGKESVTNLLITNHPNMRGSNMFIDKYIIDNDSRRVNLNIGYNSNIYHYNKTEDSAFMNKLDTITNPTNDPFKMSMKSLNPESNIKKYYMGKLDEDNVHTNFLYAKKQNENNIDFLQKIRMNIILTNSNMSIYRFQHIELIIYELGVISNESLVGDEEKTDSYRINEKLSGDWLITGINYLYLNGAVSQEITLVKRELNIEYDKEKLDDITKKFYEYKNN